MKTIREMATRYWVRCRQTGDNIEWFDTFEEAQADLEKYEAEDKKEEIYEEDFYEIYEEEPSDADIIFTLKHLTSRDGLTAEADQMIAETEYDLLVELFADKTVAEINDEKFARMCEDIADECEAEGYPSHGSNYDLRVEALRKRYYGEEEEDDE